VETIDKDFLVGYSTVFTPASTNGKAGQGFLLAVKKSRHYHVQDWTSDESSLWVKLTFFQGGRPLFVGCTYVPPSGSPLLNTISAAQRFENLQLQILAATDIGDVICGGDFNARIGDRNKDTRLGQRPRGCTDTGVNTHGSKLLELCRLSDCVLCTGAVKGDEEATPTFKATSRSRATRPDHVIVSWAHSFADCMQHSAVNVQQHGSDHKPIECYLRLPVVRNNTTCEGVLRKHLRWKPTSRGEFVGSLRKDEQVYSQRCRDVLDQGELGQAIDTLEEWIHQAAKSAGMRQKSERKGPRVDHKPFFDKECRVPKHYLRSSKRRFGTSEETKELERKYHALVRGKKRQFMAQQVKSITKLKWDDPRAFWRTLKGNKCEIPGPIAQVQHWDSFIRHVANGPQVEVLLPPLSLEAYPTFENCEGHSKLDADISVGDIEFGLRKLNTGRTSGFKGYPAELLSCSKNIPTQDDRLPESVLGPTLADILNTMYTTATIPRGANVHLVTPVFKKEDPLSTANYRPIAVPEPLMRLYSTILDNRLVEYLEGNGLRAQTQTGFRPGLSTLHQLFAIQHLIDRASRQKPLYCCFLDLSKAYDRVPQHLLWEALARLGVTGRMLCAIGSVYETAEVVMKIGERIGMRHDYKRGLLQGCPLSPTLFGVLSDGLHRHLEKYCPNVGPALSCGTRVRIFGFADDFIIVAETKEELQQLIDQTEVWCQTVDMEIGCPKTKVMVFKGSALSREPIWMCRGVLLEVVTMYKYLGIEFDQDHGIDGTYEHLASRLWAAWATLSKQYGNLKCPAAIGLLIDLYQACVPPAGTYACEVWGCRDVSPRRLEKERTNIIKTQLKILRRITGIRDKVREDVLLRELDLMPLDFGWWKRTINFYNGLVAMPVDNVYYKIARDDYHMPMPRNKSTLIQSVFKGLNAKGYVITVRGDRLPSVNLDVALDILACNADRTWQGLSDNPRTCPTEGAQLCTYKSWMTSPDPLMRRRRVLHAHLDAGKIRSFLRFRTSCHNLPVDKGRQARPRIPRMSRICEHCTMNEIGDEMHLVFECPAVQHVRDQYAHLFTFATSTMRTFLWQDDIISVIKYVVACMDILG